MGLTKNYLLESEMYSSEEQSTEVEEFYLDPEKGITQKTIWITKVQTEKQS